MRDSSSLAVVHGFCPRSRLVVVVVVVGWAVAGFVLLSTATGNTSRRTSDVSSWRSWVVPVKEVESRVESSRAVELRPLIRTEHVHSTPPDLLPPPTPTTSTLLHQQSCHQLLPTAVSPPPTARAPVFVRHMSSPSRSPDYLKPCPLRLLSSPSTLSSTTTTTTTSFLEPYGSPSLPRCCTPWTLGAEPQ
ncbi:hypothetical protein BKA81DRAFT_130509 [Phyllosticta paracitricarpa]|uniref:Uncharacterized protein n=1 Tax=Phyllosticta paracitricarpa TaxID=2016321 RepID=A0ABR1N4V9_9PEZI